MATKRRSSSKKPATKKPAATKPVAKKPVAKKPATKKPATTKPVATKPVATKPATKKPATKKPVAKKPVAKKPVATKPVAKKPAAKKPAAKKPVAKKPVAKKPVAKKPAPQTKGAPNSKAPSIPLFDRLSAWLSLFGKRSDVTFSQEPELAPPDAAPPPMPADMRDMATRTSFVKLAYKLPDPRPFPDRGDPDGYLFLSLKGAAVNVYLDIPKKGQFDSAIELDCDYYGSGKAAFYVAGAKAPFIVWDVEDAICFPSLEAYVTAGARLAFCDSLRGGPWQKNPKAVQPLLERSLPKSTHLSVVRDALVARGAAPDMADALVAWLGPDCVLLLEK